MRQSLLQSRLCAAVVHKLEGCECANESRVARFVVWKVSLLVTNVPPAHRFKSCIVPRRLCCWRSGCGR